MAKARVRKLRSEGGGKPPHVANGRSAEPTEEGEGAVAQSGLVFVSARKPAVSDGTAEQEPVQEVQEPVACGKTAPAGDVVKQPPQTGGSTSVPSVDLRSPRGEFSLRIGSLDLARESILRTYMTLVLWPMFTALTILVVLMAQDAEEVGDMIASMEFILGSAVVMGVPLMLTSWFHGLYPKGSYGRFAAGTVFACLLVTWLVLVLVISDLQGGLAGLGAELRLEWALILVCLSPVFYFGATVSELVDDRAAWRKKMGAELKEPSPDLRSRFVDFDRRVGKFGKGNSEASRAYLKFLVIPVMLLVCSDCLLGRMDLEAKYLILSTISAMFATVLVFGTALVILRFLHGFYPCGSVSRAVFGISGVFVMIVFAWAVVMNSGLESELEQNGFIIDMTVLMLPVLMFVGFLVVFEASELKDCRRMYRRSVGLPVEPYVPAELYNRFDDFRTFYASFTNGSREGRIILYKYALEILAIVILVAIGVSVYESPSAGDLNETVRSYLNPPDLENRMQNMIIVLVALAVANTFWEFLAWSYREGSFARLAMSGVVALVASQWAYSFWSTLAKIIQSKWITDVINYIMFAAFGFIMIRAVREVYKGFLRNRNKYLQWRLSALKNEAPPAAHAPPQAPSSSDTAPRNVNGRGA
jgi:hypothetical protein